MDIESNNIIYKMGLRDHFIYLTIGSVILCIINFEYYISIILCFIIHVVIDIILKDLVKSRSISRGTDESIEIRAHVIHQLAHIVAIYIIGALFVGESSNFMLDGSNVLLKWILLLIIIVRPTNMNFKVLFQKYAPKECDDEDTVEGAGAIIGILERLLVSVLLYYNQFGAIGLVFTAKSVARFDKISKEPSFAEYYLIGSLFSILSVLVWYLLIFN